jgi:HAD superfamily phosphoserine phosphatase-like hydrolase
VEKGARMIPFNAQVLADTLSVSLSFLLVEPDAQSSRQTRRSFVARAAAPFRLVAFDLDGTLIQGMEYSWKLVWAYLGFDDAVRREGMQKYLKGDFSYAEWCAWCCAKFMGAGKPLSKRHFRDIALAVRLTKNFSSTIQALKAGGCAVALISGGIDALMYEIIPDADELFNRRVFINRFVFSDDGTLVNIEPTDGDFEGKRVVLERVCKELGCTLSETVFVGDNLNDEHLIAASEIGLKIAYNATSPRVRALADVVIPTDDLSLILPHILDAS